MECILKISAKFKNLFLFIDSRRKRILKVHEKFFGIKIGVDHSYILLGLEAEFEFTPLPCIYVL